MLPPTSFPTSRPKFGDAVAGWLTARGVRISICVLMALFGLYVFLRQMWSIHTLWTPVGFVDTWPLYERLFKYTSGQLSLDHYLLDPHVHPHLIVFFLYLMDVMYGSGRQLVPHLATLLSIVGLIATIWFSVWRSSSDQLSCNPRSCAFFIGTLVLLSGVSEATAIPFQTVVVTSRFVYIALLAALVFCQFRPNKMLHIASLAASVVAVSFYASGGVFAAEIILLHFVFYRREQRRWLFASMLPLLTYILMSAYYSHSSPIRGAIHQIRFAAIGEIALGSVCYYASALASGWPAAIGFGFGISEIAILALGFIVGASTVAWAIYVLSSLWLQVRQQALMLESSTIASCLMALISLSVFGSSLSAALLWLARAKHDLGMPIHYAVLTSNRYAAFASLAFMVFLFIAMTMKQRVVATILSLMTFLIVTGIALNSMSNEKMQNIIGYYRDRPELAATALLMGTAPTDPEASAVFPDAGPDPAWPETALYLRDKGISYTHGMPALGERHITDLPTTPITDYQTQPVAEKPAICRLNGNAAPLPPKSLIAPQRFFIVTIESGEIIGYALHVERDVKGHVLCAHVDKQQQLFISAQD